MGVKVADGRVLESGNVIDPELRVAPGVVMPDDPEIVTAMFYSFGYLALTACTAASI